MPSIYRLTESLLRLRAVQKAFEAVSTCSGCIAICEKSSNVWDEIHVCSICGNRWQSKRIGWNLIGNEVDEKMFAALTQLASCIEEAQQDVDLPWQTVPAAPPKSFGAPLPAKHIALDVEQ